MSILILFSRRLLSKGSLTPSSTSYYGSKIRLKFSKKEPIWQISSIKENLFPPQTPSQPGLPFRSWRSGSKRLSKRKKRRNLSKPPQIILHDITAILCGDSLL